MIACDYVDGVFSKITNSYAIHATIRKRGCLSSLEGEIERERCDRYVNVVRRRMKHSVCVVIDNTPVSLVTTTAAVAPTLGTRHVWPCSLR